MPILIALLALSLASTPTLEPDDESDAADPPTAWSFPEVDLSTGGSLPNFALPTTESEQPVFLHDLLAGKKTVLHIFASW
ncbi:MAG: hypothetical protein AAF488_00070 [Planctomycetota bacterium]